VIKIEFVGYAQAKNGQSACTISQLKSVKVDPQAISGIDYHSVESRKASFEFYCTDWVKTNFVDTFSYISNTKYNIFAIRYSIDDVTEYIGYVKPTDVKYDQRTKMVKISCADIVGVLLELADTDKIYEEGQKDIGEFLVDEIGDILSDYDVDISNDADDITYNLNERVIYQHESKFFPWAARDGLYLTGGSVGGWSATIRNITSNGLTFQVRMCDYRTIQSLGICRERIKSLFFIFTKSFEIYDVRYTDDDTWYEYTGYEHRLWNDWINSYYGTDVSNTFVTIPNPPNGNMTLTFRSDNNWPDHLRTNIYFAGYMQLENIYLYSDDENEYIETNQKTLIKNLLLLLNAGLLIAKNGDITITEKSLLESATNIDNYLLDNEQGFILHSEAEFDFGHIKNFETYERIIKNYYDNLFESFRFEYNMEVSNTVDLALGDTIAVNGKDMKIVEIDEPYNMNIYIIKAWGE